MKLKRILAILAVAALLIGVFPLTALAAAKTFYVSPNGSNDNDGLSPQRPLKDVEGVLAKAGILNPGDKLLFEGGYEYPGEYYTIRMSGTAQAPVELGSYGTGRATIKAVDNPTKTQIMMIETAMYAYIHDLNFSAPLGTDYGTVDFVPGNNLIGIEFYNAKEQSVDMGTIRIANCSFTGMKTGVLLASVKNDPMEREDGSVVHVPARAAGTYSGITVENCEFDKCYHLGLSIHSYHTLNNGPTDTFHNVVVRNNVFTEIKGDPNLTGEGQAMTVSNADGVLIENNYFADCCGTGGAKAGMTLGGSTSFAVECVRHFKILGNVVTGTKCNIANDGSAIDMDHNCQYGEVAYNLTYNNDGPSIQCGSFLGRTKNLVTGEFEFGDAYEFNQYIDIHHNVSYNDVQGCKAASEQGAIRFFGSTKNVNIFNNTIIIDSYRQGTPSCIGFEHQSSTAKNGPCEGEEISKYNDYINVYNNIFKVAAGIIPIRANATSYKLNSKIGEHCTFDYNIYDIAGGNASSAIVYDDFGGSYGAANLQTWRTNRGEDASTGATEKNGQIGVTVSFPDLGSFTPLTKTNYQDRASLKWFDPAEGAVTEAGKYPFTGVYDDTANGYTVSRGDFHGVATAVFDLGAATPIAFPIGDVTGDNAVDLTDVTRYKKYMAAAGDYDMEYRSGDCNGDNRISIADIARLKKYLAAFNPKTGISSVTLGLAK